MKAKILFALVVSTTSFNAEAASFFSRLFRSCSAAAEHSTSHLIYSEKEQGVILSSPMHEITNPPAVRALIEQTRRWRSMTEADIPSTIPDEPPFSELGTLRAKEEAFLLEHAYRIRQARLLSFLEDVCTQVLEPVSSTKSVSVERQIDQIEQMDEALDLVYEYFNSSIVSIKPFILDDRVLENPARDSLRQGQAEMQQCLRQLCRNTMRDNPSYFQMNPNKKSRLTSLVNISHRVLETGYTGY
jgi:hypothetical protein